jgi:hypothetical protein
MVLASTLDRQSCRLGARVISAANFDQQIRVHNLAERAKELTALLGERWHLYTGKEITAVLPYFSAS